MGDPRTGFCQVDKALHGNRDEEAQIAIEPDNEPVNEAQARMARQALELRAHPRQIF